jgi:hypothetical protein
MAALTVAQLSHSFALEVCLAPTLGVPEGTPLMTYTAGRPHARNERWEDFFSGNYADWNAFLEAWGQRIRVRDLPWSLQQASRSKDRENFSRYIYEFYAVQHSTTVRIFWRAETGFGLKAIAHIADDDAQSRSALSLVVGHHTIITPAQHQALRRRGRGFSVVEEERMDGRVYRALLTGPLSLINHACAVHANVFPYHNDPRLVNQTDWRQLEASRYIRPGEELLADYGNTYGNLPCYVCDHGPMRRSPRRPPRERG